jgi:hypothetical protein
MGLPNMSDDKEKCSNKRTTEPAGSAQIAIRDDRWGDRQHSNTICRGAVLLMWCRDREIFGVITRVAPL